MSKRDVIEVATSLLSGAGIGAMAMYLLDPDRGENRRAALRGQAYDAAAAAEHALESSWHTVADSARSAGRYVADQAGNWTDDARHAARGLSRDAASKAGDYGRQLHRRAGSYLGYDQGPSVGTISGVAAGVVSALSLGAGLMFLFDPTQGRRRRAAAREKAIDYGHTAGQYVQDAAHSVAEHARGAVEQAGDMAEQVKNKVTGTAEKAAGETQKAAGQAEQSGDQLLENIRGQIRRLSGDLHGVQVRSENGQVTLSGSAPTSRLEEIVATVRRIAGVKGVENHLNMQNANH